MQGRLEQSNTHNWIQAHSAAATSKKDKHHTVEGQRRPNEEAHRRRNGELQSPDTRRAQQKDEKRGGRKLQDLSDERRMATRLSSDPTTSKMPI